MHTDLVGLLVHIMCIIIYIKILLDYDWVISVQLIPNSTVQFSVITVQKFVTN
jgi:hypothetical protein